MCASRTYAFIHLNPRRPVAGHELDLATPRRRWVKDVLAWLTRRRPDVGKAPAHYLENNHLRRDIGLPPIWPDGWPH